MAKPYNIWVPLRGQTTPKRDDGIPGTDGSVPRNTDRAPNQSFDKKGRPKKGQGDDTADVARAAAAAINSATAMGDIPWEHRKDIEIELDKDPPEPGNTRGRITFRGLSHYDSGATEGKLSLAIDIKRPKGGLEIKVRRLPVPTGGGKPDGGRGYRSKNPKPGKGPEFPPDPGPWKRVPIRPEFRQFGTRRRKVYGAVAVGVDHGADPHSIEETPIGRSRSPFAPTRGRGTRVATFEYTDVSEVRQAELIRRAIERLGLPASRSGATVRVTHLHRRNDDNDREIRIVFGVGDERGEGDSFPWELVFEPIGVETMRFSPQPRSGGLPRPPESPLRPADETADWHPLELEGSGIESPQDPSAPQHDGLRPTDVQDPQSASAAEFGVTALRNPIDPWSVSLGMPWMQPGYIPPPVDPD